MLVLTACGPARHRSQAAGWQLVVGTGTDIPLLNAQRVCPPQIHPAASWLQTPISSTYSLDPWLTLHHDSSVIQNIFIRKQRATGHHV